MFYRKLFIINKNYFNSMGENFVGKKEGEVVGQGLWGQLENSLEALRNYVETHLEADSSVRELAYHPRPDTEKEAKKLLERMQNKLRELSL